jgi:DNA-binding Xre family transcriptional regulator
MAPVIYISKFYTKMDLKSTDSGVKIVYMFPIEVISSITWDTFCAVRLKELRKKESRKAVLSRMQKYGVEISPQMLQKLEDGIAKTITPNILTALCNAYDVTYTEIIKLAKPTVSDSEINLSVEH